MKQFLLATAFSVVCLSGAQATDYRFFCTNQSDPAINPDHDGVFVAITYGTAQSFDVVHTINKQLYDRHAQYSVTSITHPASNSYFWKGFMLKDPRVIMTGHLWETDGVWMYVENRTFTDGRPPEMATPPVVCRNTVDIRQPTIPNGRNAEKEPVEKQSSVQNQASTEQRPDQVEHDETAKQSSRPAESKRSEIAADNSAKLNEKDKSLYPIPESVTLALPRS